MKLLLQSWQFIVIIPRMNETTLDGILNKRIALEQPAQGFRVAVDTVLLAAAVPAKAGDRVLDMGCGVGGAMLALACRVPEIAVTGLEIQSALAQLCVANIERNVLQSVLEVAEVDLTQLPSQYENDFDHVMMNPPYHDEARHDSSGNASKRTANTESEGDLERWFQSAARALKLDGVLTLIHRADRLDEILRLLSVDFGAINIKLILPKGGVAPKRVIVRAEKGGMESPITLPPLVLHNADGSYTTDAENILRHVSALVFL